MVWQQTPYSLPLAATAVFLFGFAAYLWSLDRSRWVSGTSLGGLLLFAGGSWVGIYTLRLSATTIPGKLLWLRLEFLPVLALSVVWLAYVVRYTGRTDWLSWRVFGPLTTAVAGIELLVLTDGVHHLVYREYGLAQVGSFTVFDPVYGPGFAVYLGFSYTLLAASLLFLATAAAHARGVFRWQIAVLFLFATVPGVTGILHVTGNTPVAGLNLPALSLAVSTGAVAVSFARFRWTEMTPIARDQTFEAMTEAVVVLDAANRIVDLNPAAEGILSEPGASLVGAPATEVLPELAETLDAIDEAAGASARDTRTELTIRDGGDRRCLNVRVSPIGAPVGEPTGYTVLLHDITARKVAEERAEERRQKIEHLHRVACDLTAAHTREEVFQRAVDGGRDVLTADVCRLSIETEGALVPTANSGDDAVDRHDPQPVDRGIAGETFQSGVSVVVDDLADARSAAPGSDPGLDRPERALPAVDTEPSHRALLSAPIGDIGIVQALATDPGAFGDDDREVLELLTTHIETAAQRADAESELRTERDRLEEFASVVSHDLRNPLNVAQGHAELLEGDHVEPIDRSLSRMETIITDILTLARDGDAVGDVRAVDLGTCTEEAWTTVDTGRAVLRRPDALGTVDADSGRLRQLLENLFRNAVEHSTDGRTEPTVTIGVGRIDDGTGFYVEDDGPGIPPDQRDAVFDRGYTTRSDGTGLGLPIVERIADAHGWTVAAAESSTGGARFEIRTGG